MSRGNYNFRSDSEHFTYKSIISIMVNALLTSTSLDSVDLTKIDICPSQVEAILEELGWYRVEHNQDRYTKWEYFENDEYPNKFMSLIIDFDTFSIALDILDKEE